EWLQPCPQLFWISAGLFESLPRILGLSDAMVVVDATSRRCSFRITPPPSLTLWSRMRRAMSAIFYARAAIEEMSEQQQSLKRRFTELEQARDLAEQERQAAESARMIAEDALDTRSRLLATMSHELRTPLSGILGFSELLMATGLDDEQRQLGGQVVRSGEAMRGLIDNILDLSSVSSGNLSLHPVSLHLQQITAPLAARFTQQAASQGLQLIFEVTEGADQLKLDADPGRLRQVLDNLLDNALKYTDSGTIHLRVSRGVGGGIRVEVIDSGAGIPVGERQRIFESYTQVDGSFSRRHGGAGLGLAICRSLIQMMGGQIGYTPVEAGGSCFWIELPLPAGSVPTESAPSPVVVKLPITVAPRSWVLVAEDNPINQLLIRRHLTDLGCTFEIAPDGEVAARLYEKGRHDIVLMDCHMPGVDGFEATARIRGLDPTLSSVPIVAVTANASPGDRQRCLDAGMDDYLSKPFSRAQLVAIMSRWLCEEQRQAS
ncbi:MAG: signal transduction histidine kinase/CheY-like chemotaxis protein, partial [Myxococcota bacterium]